MSLVVLGLAVGLLFGAGTGLIMAASLPERPSLVTRVLPYVPEVAARLASPTALRAGPSPLRRSWRDSQSRRLQRAGLVTTVATHRIERLRWGVVTVAGVAVGWMVVGLDPTRHGDWLVLLMGGAFLAGVAACEVRLARTARLRQRRMTDELPGVAEQISWAVCAGLSLDAALARLADRGQGTLVAELARLNELRTDGMRLSAALRVVGEGAVPPPMQRYLVSLGVALERGSPMTEVAATHASAVLEAARRRGRPAWVVLAWVLAVVVCSTLLALAFVGTLS